MKEKKDKRKRKKKMVDQDHQMNGAGRTILGDEAYSCGTDSLWILASALYGAPRRLR